MPGVFPDWRRFGATALQKQKESPPRASFLPLQRSRLYGASVPNDLPCPSTGANRTYFCYIFTVLGAVYETAF